MGASAIGAYQLTSTLPLATLQADGLICVKTNQAVLVGHYTSPVLPGQATKEVESLADYLIGQGY